MTRELNFVLIFYFMLTTRIFSASVDCPVIMNFLQGLNLHLTDPIFYQNIPADCCGYRIYTPPVGSLYIECTGSGSSQFITRLQLGYVRINGTIKSQYLTSSLFQLQILGTSLSSSIPNDLPNSIRDLFLGGNMFRSLPTTFPNALYNLYLGENMITGTFPINLPNSIQYLYVNDNKLQGAISNTLPSQLLELGVSNNQFDVFPISFPNNLEYLFMDGNKFTKMPNLPPNIFYVEIFNNLIYDKLPNSFAASLNTLDASNNMIYGTIPTPTSSMRTLYLSKNQLNGSLPANLASLSYFQVDSNYLTGALPNTWNTYISQLNISHNSFTGAIPKFNLTSSPYIFDLSWNNFTGNLPILISKQFRIADLSHNQLSGDIDLGYSNIKDLRLSFNKFTKYPKSLPQAINTLKLDNNQMYGNIIYDLPGSLSTIDLSSNNFTGNIPNWQINATRIYFNISNNLFTGTIPQSLQSVATLDLSNNHLSGCINYQFTGSNFYFNNNYLSGNLSFKLPVELHLQNNSITDVIINNATVLSQCDLSNNPIAPGVFGKTFKNQCNLNGTYVNSRANCRVFALNETGDPFIKVETTTVLTTTQSKTTLDATSTQIFTTPLQPQVTSDEITTYLDVLETVLTRISLLI
eukprot:NODE_82_length_22625_cov_0.476516.p3 type:complete len:635 gc:universal NODE_82_length_22625_cov_0.476516:19146-21050(+)